RKMDKPLVIQLQGEFDIYRCAELEQLLAPALLTPYAIVDLSGVRYIDSSALAALVRMRKRRVAAGYPAVVFVSGPPQVKMVFHITRLDELWTQCETLDGAYTAIENVRNLKTQ
ncbi:MAG: STAS domain-containing protein, partial [Candidatus Baltobacteraceae bacterium]